jgi:hypothetical protein
MRCALRLLMKTSLFFLTSLFLFSAIGCGGPDPADCASRTPSIASGVYGCITSTNDVGDTNTSVKPNFEVQAFDTHPSEDPNDGLAPEARAVSDAEGFYEMPLAAGHHWICTAFRRCTEKDLGNGTRRLNYSFSIAPGWSN